MTLERTIRRSEEMMTPSAIHTQAVIDRELLDLCRLVVGVLSDVHLRLSVIHFSSGDSH